MCGYLRAASQARPKIDFAENWVHLRKSNTEPIIRVYTEAKSMAEADALAQRFIGEIKEICNI